MYERMRNEMKATIQETILQLFNTAPEQIRTILDNTNKRQGRSTEESQKQKQARTQDEAETSEGPKDMETEQTRQSDEPSRYSKLTTLPERKGTQDNNCNNASVLSRTQDARKK